MVRALLEEKIQPLKNKFLAEIKEYSFRLRHYKHKKELPEQFQDLVDQAIQASKKAYAPYSNFSVGAAILTSDGKTIRGNNQENASFPVGTCAERVALNYLRSEYPEAKLKAIAIHAYSLEFKLDAPISPCGMCRQALFEAESLQEEPIQVFLSADCANVIQIDSISDLLPLAFYSAELKNV